MSSNDVTENKDGAKKNEVIQESGGGNVITNIRKNVDAEMKRLQFVGMTIEINVGAEMKRLQFVGIIIALEICGKNDSK